MEVNCKNSVPVATNCIVLRESRKSHAWFLLHRLRLALKSRTFEKMGGDGGIVEADETFVGGKSRFMSEARRRKTFKARGRASVSCGYGSACTRRCRQVESGPG